MKKLLAILCVLVMLISGCGKSGSENGVVSEKDMLKAIAGEYLRADDIKEFKKTRSLADSMSTICSVAIRKEGGKYCAFVGDGHQGVTLGKIASVTKNEAGNYAFEAAENEKNSIKAEFMPESKMITATIKTEFASLSKEITDDYMRFDSFEDSCFYLSKILFGGIEGITEEEGSFKTEIGGKKCSILLSADAVDLAPVEGCGGAIIINYEDKDEKEFCFYVYENKKITLVNEEGKEIASFK